MATRADFMPHADVLRRVADEWYNETKGELWLDPSDEEFDGDLAEACVAMWAEGLDFVRSFDATQTRNGDGLNSDEAEADLPRRVAKALALLHYGD